MSGEWMPSETVVTAAESVITPLSGAMRPDCLSKVAEPIVMPLSDVMRPDCLSKLPLLCQYVRSSPGGRAICAKADRCVALLSKAAAGVPFLLCCAMSAKKLLVLGQDGQVYVAFCRSPIPDYRHLEEVTRLLRRARSFDAKVDIKRDMWDLLPVFGKAFVEKVIGKMRDEMQVPIVDSSLEGLERLGRVYTHFELDVAVYSGLSAIPTEDCDCNGVLSIGVISRGKQGSVGRIIVKKIARKARGSFSTSSAVPVVGLAADCDTLGGVNAWLRSSLVRQFNSVLLGPASKHRVKVFVEKGDNGNGDGARGDRGWGAALNFYLNPMPDPKWLERARLPIKVALHVGGGTVTNFLMKKLGSSSQNRFVYWVGHFSDTDVLPKTGNERMVLLGSVLQDLASTLRTMGPEESESVLRTKKEAIQRILGYVQSQPFLAPDPQVRDEKSRQGRLMSHLMNGHPAYIDMLGIDMEIDAVRQKIIDQLMRSGYSMEEIRQQLNVSPGLPADKPVAYAAEYSGCVTRIKGNRVFIEFQVEGESEVRQFACDELKVDKNLLSCGCCVVATTKLEFLPSATEPTPEEREANLRRLKEIEADWQGIRRE